MVRRTSLDRSRVERHLVRGRGNFFTEELEGLVVLHGMEYQETCDSAKHLVKLLRNAGQHDEATALAAKHGL